MPFAVRRLAVGGQGSPEDAPARPSPVTRPPCARAHGLAAPGVVAGREVGGGAPILGGPDRVRRPAIHLFPEGPRSLAPAEVSP